MRFGTHTQDGGIITVGAANSMKDTVSVGRPVIPKGRHSEGPPFSAISSTDNLQLGIRLGLRLGYGTYG